MVRDRKFKIKIDIYDVDITVYLSNDFSKPFKKICKGFPLFSGDKVSKEDSACTLYHDEYPGDIFVILCNRPSINDITHESIHVGSRILHVRGIQASHENDEPLTYLSAYITEKITERVNK